MKFGVTKNALFAVAVSFVVLSLFITFSQEEFATTVSLNLLFFKTEPHQILLFVSIAFVLGLLIGLFVAVVDHIHMKAEVKDLKRNLTQDMSTVKDVTEMTVVEDDS